MTRFPSLCAALSAAALLAGALPGQAQSQTLTDPRITGVASGQQIATDGINSHLVNTGLDLVRLTEGSEDIQRALTVTVEPEGDPAVTFTDIGVRGNGVYRGRLENGVRVSGTLSGFGSAAFADPDAELIVSGTATVQDPGAALGVLVDVPYETNYGAGGWRDLLRQLLYMESQYESARYAGATERLGERDPIITSTVTDHINRGNDIGERAADVLSADVRLYVNGEDAITGNPYSCNGFECSVRGSIPEFETDEDGYVIFFSGDFITDDPTQVDVVQSHRGIHLVLDRSGRPYESNALLSSLSFGAWMNDAGFFVATSDRLSDVSANLVNSAQIAVAAGERTGSAPDANARWLGSMVGTVLAGENKDHLLRGGARLRFNMRRSLLYAEFFNIRDYDRFGAKHIMQEVETGPRNRLRFRRIPVNANGTYGRTYGEDEGGGGIRGAFYGDGQAETAGTFDRYGILAAFGAKKLTN